MLKKRSIIVFLILIIIFTTGCHKTPTDERAGFNIEDGVLISYTGASTRVEIPSSVARISDSAFSSDIGNAMNAQIVIIPGTVKEISGRAFMFSEAKTVVIEEGTEIIGEYAFAESYIDDIYIPESVTQIDEGLILQVEGGEFSPVIHCIEGSVADKYFQNFSYEIEYDYDNHEKI